MPCSGREYSFDEIEKDYNWVALAFCCFESGRACFMKNAGQGIRFWSPPGIILMQASSI